jgi:hypothetical protein
MTGAERSYITASLGAPVMTAVDRVDATGQTDPAAWRALALALALSARDEILSDARYCQAFVTICERAGVLPVCYGDAMVRGRIGSLNLSTGCYSFYESMGLAARHIARSGQRALAQNILRSGITVRELLRRVYGITAAPSGDSSPASERRAFLRALRSSRTTEAVN